MNELALVLRDPEMRTVITRDFDEDQIGQLVLRWIVSLNDSLDRHRAEIQRLRKAIRCRLWKFQSILRQKSQRTCSYSPTTTNGGSPRVASF